MFPHYFTRSARRATYHTAPEPLPSGDVDQSSLAQVENIRPPAFDPHPVTSNPDHRAGGDEARDDGAGEREPPERDT